MNRSENEIVIARVVNEICRLFVRYCEIIESLTYEISRLPS